MQQDIINRKSALKATYTALGSSIVLVWLLAQVRKIGNVSGAGLCCLILDMGPSLLWEGIFGSQNPTS